MASKTIEAAGGIVVRKGAGKLIAVVQRAKDDAWVLPRGKLKRDENPAAAARREVVEETGHRVEVHEYLGAITYRAGGRPKVVQFWRMEAEREASHELMKDIVAVEWLPLKAAVRRLSYPLEKLFLRHAAARALKKRRAEAKSAKSAKAKTAKRKTAKTKTAKTNPAKIKLRKTGKVKSDKTSTKPRPVTAASSTKKAFRSLAKPLRKQPQKTKAGKAKSGKVKNSAKAKDKKKNKSERKSGKPKKGKGKKSGRERPVAVWSAADTQTGTKPALRPVENPMPTNSGALPATPARDVSAHAAEEHKTILQRMLGRLAG